MTDNAKLMNKLKADPALMDKMIEQANSSTDPVLHSSSLVNQRVYTPKKVEERLSRYRHESEVRKQAIKNKVPFLAPVFDGVFSLTRGLVLVGAKSGHAKSTTAANIVAHFLESVPEGDAIVISNEEASEAVLNRISCAMLRKSFVRFHKGEMPDRDQRAVEDLVPSIAERIEVIDDGAWNMTVLEDVISVLEYAAKKDVRMVVVDYLQTVNTSSSHPEYEAVRISKMLGFYLKEYGRKVSVPVIVFAQLKPASESPDISARFQNDKTIYNHAFAVIEIMPDFENRTTNFVIHKDRFGYSQGKQVTMGFQDGRYVTLEYDI